MALGPVTSVPRANNRRRLALRWYEFRPDGLLPHLPHAKVKAALRERLAVIELLHTAFPDLEDVFSVEELLELWSEFEDCEQLASIDEACE